MEAADGEMQLMVENITDPRKSRDAMIMCGCVSPIEHPYCNHKRAPPYGGVGMVCVTADASSESSQTALYVVSGR